MASVPARWLRTNVAHVCDARCRGRPGLTGMYFATVSLLTSCPSFASSAAIRRRLQVGFSRAICSINATTVAISAGRPTRLDFHAQNTLKPRRCQPITVAGLTIAITSTHRDQSRESTTQNARSMGRRRGRRPTRSTASCCRSARFSATRFDRDRNAATAAPTIAPKSPSIVLTIV